ncbi:ankyrin repeat and SOCS box protein 8-like isoform X1 [Papaver somniferum]|uniref:ankyrin repeat and SOCS box protein 8-like isoform X1 n=1 Tax=Papaver somniferum TaxID=3469 RepID=UPI000E6F909E|nr:ankyrin repeat and SOCS box protein 8-like isoform X1 [Papaver somniferum]
MGANPEIPNGTAMFPYLLKVGIDPEILNGTDMIRYPLKMGSNPEIPNGTDMVPMNPLHHAAAEGHHGIITLLLSKGVNIDVSNGFGSPLLHACAVGRHDTVKLLLDHNANPNWLVGEAATPLQASIYPNLGNAWRLYSRQVLIQMVDQMEWKLCHMLLKWGQHQSSSYWLKLVQIQMLRIL